MSFFDRKEEVLDFQLTRYGKKKMIKGEMNPYYYSFHDEDILYDAEYAGLSESSSDAEERITQDTVYLKPQSIYTEAGSEQDTKKPDEIALNSRLGTVELSTKNPPAFQLDMLRGGIDNFSNESGSLDNDVKQAQQINLEPVQYSVTVSEVSRKDNGSPSNRPDAGVVTKDFQDGTRINVDGSSVLIALDEENTPFKNSNFDVEVFEIEEKDNGENIMHRKKFFTEQEEGFQEIYEPEESQESPGLTPDAVEYFLDIEIDEEISREELCKLVQGSNTKDIFAEDLDCDGVDVNDRVKIGPDNVYDSNVDPSDTGEKCP